MVYLFFIVAFDFTTNRQISDDQIIKQCLE